MRRSTRFRFYPAIFLISGACDLPTAAGGSAAVYLSVAPGSEASYAFDPEITVVDHAEVALVQTGDTIGFVRQPIKREASLVRLEVPIPKGELAFQAAIVSNSGMPLFRGQAGPLVPSSGMTIEIPITAINPIPGARPDTLPITMRLDTIPAIRWITLHGTGAFELGNFGVGTATWTAESATPAAVVCDAISWRSMNCDVSLSSSRGTFNTSGIVAVGRTDSLYVEVFRAAIPIDILVRARISTQFGVLQVGTLMLHLAAQRGAGSQPGLSAPPAEVRW
jgi:hypothetical protein